MIHKIILFLWLMAFSTSLGYCQDQPLRFTLKADKQVYKVGEDIRIHLELKNVGRKQLKLIDLKKASGYLIPCQVLVFSIKDSSGDQVPYLGGIRDEWPGEEENLSVVSPNKIMSHDITINGKNQYAINKAGTYQISASYYGSVLIRTVASSNTVTLQVLEKK